MKNNYLKLLSILVMSLVLTMVFAVTSMAAITVENGVVVGLDTSASYQYAPVNLSNYTSPTYTSVATGADKIEGLDVGLYNIKNTATNEIVTVWIEGAIEDRNDIGSLYLYEKNDVQKELLLRDSSTENFVQGTWTGKGADPSTSFATHYISETSTDHFSGSLAQRYANGQLMLKMLVNNYLQKIVYKYAYSDDEILPIDDLYTFSFKTGVRQGALSHSYAEDAPDTYMKSKYVLYTMTEDGEVHMHTYLTPTNFPGLNSTVAGSTHAISVAAAFPDAEGWVLGLEIYPYGQIPTEGLNLVASLNKDGGYTNTCLYIEYSPNEYLTKYEIDSVKYSYQYNGTNIAYVTGYSDGSFAPDAEITRAEVVAILSRLLLNDKELPSYTASRFLDVSVGDWFYNNVNYLDNLGFFSHIAGSLFKPNEAITRGELAQIIYNLSPEETSDNTKKAFDDVTSEHQYYQAIKALAEDKIIKGYGDDTYRPDNTVTRAEAIAIFNRTFNLVANESTVAMESVSKKFNDIDNHWAIYDILLAANENVKTVAHATSDETVLYETEKTINFETNHITVSVNKNSGAIKDIVNKATGESIVSKTLTPWFAYVTDQNGTNLFPIKAELVDGRIAVTFINDLIAYFVVNATDNYFTVELDSSIPKEYKKIRFAQFPISCEYSTDVDSYRISMMSMNINTNPIYWPGGESKTTAAEAMTRFGVIGAKAGITFSKFGGNKKGEHRAYLKEITDAIDENVGIKSTHGGAYSFDNADAYYDYGLLSTDLYPTTVLETAELMNKYNINQVDIHQGGSTFIQGNFDFVCADRTYAESYTTAAQYKERIGQVLIDHGIQMALHTYSSGVSASAYTITSNPKWQRQIAYNEEQVLTLAEDVTATSTFFKTLEDASGIINYGWDSKSISIIKHSLPYVGPTSSFFLIDEEIFTVDQVSVDGLTLRSASDRAQSGTTAVAHKAGAEIRQLYASYSQFQPAVDSELFIHVAENTAKAYNDGGFEMIYLDGFESFDRANTDVFVPKDEAWYFYALFAHNIIKNCNTDPLMEGSNFPYCFWNARTRAGAADHSSHMYKVVNLTHLKSNEKFTSRFLTSTIGWFHYGPDFESKFKNSHRKTLFIDDLDHMGSLSIAFDVSTAYQPFSVSNFKNYLGLSNNALYYSLYQRFRKAYYFSDEVKAELQEGFLNGKEYKIEEQLDGTWAFREMKYVKHRIYDNADSLFTSGTLNNAFDSQTPYVRIENRYSTLGAESDELLVYDFDESAEINSYIYQENGTTTKVISLPSVTDLSVKSALKIEVLGNEIPGSAIILRLLVPEGANGQIEYLIPTSHEGWREFILFDADNADLENYVFSSAVKISGYADSTFRTDFTFSQVARFSIYTSGDVSGVMLGDLRAYTPINVPVTNPTITVGDQTFTFHTTLNSGEYIEFLPDIYKAYRHYYGDLSSSSADNAAVTDGYNGNAAFVEEISVSGSLTVPAGDFNFTYNGTTSVAAPQRARVVFGFRSSELIKDDNPPENIPEGVTEGAQYVTVQRTSTSD